MKRAEGDGHTLRAVPVLQGLESCGNIVQGFVPGNLLPGSLAPLPRALEWPVDAPLLIAQEIALLPVSPAPDVDAAVRAVQFGSSAALNTDKPLTDRMLCVAADVGDASLLYMGEHATLEQTSCPKAWPIWSTAQKNSYNI